MLEKKEEIRLISMTKAPIPANMSKGQSENTNNATKKLYYTAVADRHRTLTWRTTAKLVWFTGFTGPTFQLTATAI